MLRFSLRCFLSFDTLLCGLRPVAQKETETMMQRYQELTSRPGLLPLPLATSIAAQLPLNTPKIMSLLAGHTLVNHLACSIALEWRNPQRGAGLKDYLEYLNVLRKVDASVPSVVFVAQCAAKHYQEQRERSKGKDLEEDREALREWITRFVRYHPSAAPALLGPLCRVSACEGEMVFQARDDVVDVLHAAQRAGFVAPEDAGRALRLLPQANRVLSVWGWLQYTSAKWDQTAASAAVVAMTRQRRFGDAVAILQSLASVHVVPTAEAQAAFIDLLLHTSPPLPHYADQLLSYWYPAGSGLFQPQAVPVAAAQLFLHFRCGNYERSLDLLHQAAERLTPSLQTPEGITSFLHFVGAKGLLSVVRYFLDDIVLSSTMRPFFYDRALEMIEDLSSSFAALSILILLSRRLDRLNPGTDELTRVTEKLQKLANAISDESFTRMMRVVAEDYSFNSSQETQELMQAVASVLSREVPVEISAWVKLV